MRRERLKIRSDRKKKNATCPTTHWAIMKAIAESDEFRELSALEIKALWIIVAHASAENDWTSWPSVVSMARRILGVAHPPGRLYRALGRLAERGLTENLPAAHRKPVPRRVLVPEAALSSIIDDDDYHRRRKSTKHCRRKSTTPSSEIDDKTAVSSSIIDAPSDKSREVTRESPKSQDETRDSSLEEQGENHAEISEEYLYGYSRAELEDLKEVYDKLGLRKLSLVERVLEQGYGARWLYALARYIRGRRIEDKGGYAFRALSAPEEFDECVQRVLAESDASPKNDQRNPAAATLGSHKQTTRKQRKKRGGAAHAEREREEKRRRLARARKEQERMDRATTYDNVTDYLREEAE